MLVYEALARQDKPVQAWIARGINPDGAHKCWHITSTEISEQSFPKLGSLFQSGRRFAHAISFHGHKGSEVIVGGGEVGDEHAAFKKRLCERIAAALPGVTVRVKTSGDLAGAQPANIVNRVTKLGNGIQIEQPRSVRRDDVQRAAIANAVVESYAGLI